MRFKFYYVCNYGFIKNTLLPLLIFHCDVTKINAINKLCVNRGISLNSFIAVMQLGNKACVRFATAVCARMILHTD